MSSFMRPAARRQYLRRCIRISLLKRWRLIAAGGVLGLAVAWILLGTWWAVVVGVLGVVLMAWAIAVDSHSRHRLDV